MSKTRSQPKRPIAKASSGTSKVKLAAHAPKGKSAQAAGKKASGRKVKLHRSEAAEPAQAPARQVPWWVFPENERMMPGPGGTPSGPAQQIGPGFGPGFGPGPGPGLFPPGPGPFPPGPGPFPPGPGPFPPGPGPFPPGLGPFPPGPPPRPPFPFPPQAFISVRVAGGFAFPGASTATYVPFFPGITIGQALWSSGLVVFGPRGGIIAVSGIRIGGRVGLRIRYNGRLIPETLLNFPAEPNSSIVLELFVF
ncbi:hypothetical protein [Cohnella zeiphila]|uniref:Uncharacterized protein n=1 Tax=Cohnella zeiphila TaxID=2761120 RepID=A0A7X0SL46_9BACL|nr:hypothetical protein [Cohnella zeiphila]MBB6732012.1 hypothetical protein [Cohnella zeiphila]